MPVFLAIWIPMTAIISFIVCQGGIASIFQVVMVAILSFFTAALITGRLSETGHLPTLKEDDK
jgi:membrane protein implicated in regulation of membrane protease activity